MNLVLRRSVTVDSYPYHQNEAFAKLFRDGFKEERQHVLIENNDGVSYTQCLTKIKKYMQWLDKLNAQSVMLFSEPTINSLCLMYAVVLSNRAYLPVHTSMPYAVIKKQMKAACIDLLLISPDSFSKANNDFKNAEFKGEADDFYYYKNNRKHAFSLLPGMMFFTLGTSNQPKLCHFHYEVVADYLAFCLQEFELNSTDVFLLSTELSCIDCLKPLFLPMFVGARLVVFNQKENNDIGSLISVIDTHRISILMLLPNLFKKLQTYVIFHKLGVATLNVRNVFFDGECIDAHDINQWLTFINAECDFYSSFSTCEYLMPFYRKIKQKINDEQASHFGQLRAGCDYALTVNENNSYHLYVSGGILTGYLDLPQSLSCFAIKDGKRFFKTGVLVIVKDNEMSYQGHESRLIKCFGHTINLELIERTYAHFDPMGRAAALIDSENKLLLIIEGKNNDEQASELTDYFNNHLDAFMVPKHYEFRLRLPLTASGTMDHELIRKNTMCFFQKYFTDKQVDETRTLNELDLSSLDYIELSNLIMTRTGQYFDVSTNQGNVRLSDIAFHLKSPAAPLTSGETVKLNVFEKDSFVQPFLKNKNNQACYVCRYLLANEISFYKLKKAIIATVDNHFMLSCRIIKKEQDYFFIRVKPNKNIINKKVAFAAFTPLTDEQLKTGVNDSPLVNIYLEKKDNKKYLIISFNGIALDGWSLMTLREEIFSHYEDKGVERLPSLARQAQYLSSIHYLPKVNAKNISSLTSFINNQPRINLEGLLPLFRNDCKLCNSSFALSKKTINTFIKKEGLREVSSSALFLMLMHSSISKIANVEGFIINLCLSNRISKSPYNRLLMQNLETFLPLPLFSHTTIKSMLSDLSSALSLYFHHMNYEAVHQFYQDESMKAWFDTQVSKKHNIHYRYLSLMNGANFPEDKHINWQHSSTRLSDCNLPFIFFEVCELSDKYVINLNSKMSKGMHLLLIDAFKKLTS